MKISILSISIFVLCSALKAQTGLTFSIQIVSASHSITCTNPSVNLVASSSHSGQVNYTWLGTSTSLYGANVTITIPGVYTVTASSGTLVSPSQTVAIGSNFTFPSSVLNPFHQSITCNLSSVTTVTAPASPPVNITHKFIAPSGAIYYSQAAIGLYTPGGPGTYTHVLINDLNGCTVSKTFSVLSTQGFPTFSLTSSQNFSLGCNTKSVAVINIINAGTMPPGGPISYTLLSPATPSGLPTGLLSHISTYSVTIPGTWTVVTRDNTSFCETRAAVSILSNTFGPGITAMVPRQILTCNLPQVQLQATSGTPNVSYEWLSTIPPGMVSGNTVTTSINTAAPSSTWVTSYTLVITDNNNTCKSGTVIPIYQSIFPPYGSIASGNINQLTCYTPTIMLTNQSISTIPAGMPNSLPVVATLWNGPLPQTPATFTATYPAFTSGIYSMQVTDQNNGCKAWDTIAIFNRKTYPVVNNPSGPQPFCINVTSPSVSVYPIITGFINAYAYQWSGPPGAVITGVNTLTATANAVGIYSIVVTDSVSGCSTTGQVIVANCYTGLYDNHASGLHISIFPNPGRGLFTVLSEGVSGNRRIRICNELGMLVKEQLFFPEQNTVDLCDASDGIYFLYILENNVPVHVSKLIKQ